MCVCVIKFIVLLLKLKAKDRRVQAESELLGQQKMSAARGVRVSAPFYGTYTCGTLPLYYIYINYIYICI